MRHIATLPTYEYNTDFQAVTLDIYRKSYLPHCQPSGNVANSTMNFVNLKRADNQEVDILRLTLCQPHVNLVNALFSVGYITLCAYVGNVAMWRKIKSAFSENRRAATYPPKSRKGTIQAMTQYRTVLLGKKHKKDSSFSFQEEKITLILFPTLPHCQPTPNAQVISALHLPFVQNLLCHIATYLAMWQAQNLNHVNR